MAASVGTVYVDVKFNMGDLRAQLQRALSGVGAGPGGPAGGAPAALQRTWSQAFTNVGNAARNVGREMTYAFTVPLTLLGRSAVSAYREFDTAMTQISALNQVNTETTEQWRGEVRALGREYGVAGEEAAKALYFITSSGQEGAAAMETLNVAIKGAAVGLGETKVVADVLTSAMSAYQQQGMTAAKAGDTLAAAVHYGKGEADELAGSLSQVIPIAANLGVSFDEVSGALAAMTLSGTSSDQAATQLRGLFNTLQDLPPQAQEALKAYTGLDYAQVRLALTSEGLIPTLKAIYDGFGDNKVAMGEVFGNIRALTGVFNLFGQNTEQTIKVITGVKNATGDLNKAWEVTAESDAKKMERAMNDVHDAMIGLGADIVPAITPVIQAVGGLAQAFGMLPDPVRNAAVAFGAFGAAAGPVLFVFGSITKNIGQLGGVIGRMSPTLAAFGTRIREAGTYMGDSVRNSDRLSRRIGNLGGAIAASTAAITLAIVAYQQWQQYMGDVARMQGDLNNVALQGAQKGGGIKGMRDELAKVKGQILQINAQSKKWMDLGWTRFGEKLEGSFDQMSRMNVQDALMKTNTQLETTIRMSEDMAKATGGDTATIEANTNAMGDWLVAEALAQRTYGTAEEALRAYNKAKEEGKVATQSLTQSSLQASKGIGQLIAASQKETEMFFAVIDAEKAVADARKGIVEANKKVVDAQDAYREAQERTLEAGRGIVKAQEQVTKATEKTAEARLKLADAERELQDTLAGRTEEEEIDLASAKLGVKEARKRLGGDFEDPLDRRRAKLDLRRAKLDLARTEGAHDEAVADARQKVADAQAGVNDAQQAELDAAAGVVDARKAQADATEAQADAFDAIATAKEGIATAEDTLLRATINLEPAQAALDGAIASGAIHSEKFLAYMQGLADLHPELAPKLDDYAHKMQAIADASKAANAAPPPPAPGRIVTNPNGDVYVQNPDGTWTQISGRRPNAGPDYLGLNRAFGGPLSAGQMSSVNERGMPELWSAGGNQYLIPTTGGTVIPLRPSPIGAAAQGGDGASIGEVNVYVTGQPVQNAYEVRRQLRQQTRTGARK
jgi:TP901 family phage tail tape measure protein